MCLASGNRFQIYTAKQNIVVYKVLTQVKGRRLMPPFRCHFKYKLRTEVKEKMAQCEFDSKNHLWVTKEGLYSFALKKDAKRLTTIHSSFYIYKCIIPKGSHFMTDGKEFVSDRLIVKRKCIIQ